MNETLWRDHPSLAGRFHPDHPDDLPVLVHDGGPRLTDARPEQVWVTVTSVADEVFEGTVLNGPQQLSSVRQADTIRFLAPPGGEHLIMAAAKYLAERSEWVIRPCNQCGNGELFDAPSDLIRVIFPNIPSDGEAQIFTSFCFLCGGVQVVHKVGYETSDAPPEMPKKWWQFWK